jgi:hypothetical protein
MYNDKFFGSTRDPLTMSLAFAQGEGNTVSFDHWRVELVKYIKENPENFSENVDE